MRRIKVAHIITRLCKGGAQENTFNTVRLANCERFEVDLVSGPTRGDEGSIEDDVRQAGIEIIREPFLVRNPAPVRDYLVLRRLAKLFRSKRYDIVHTHTSKAGFLGRLAAERVGIPIVVHTPHGNIFEGYFSKYATYLFTWMERHAARRTDRIIALTPGGIGAYISQDIGQREQYRTVFSGIDLSPYAEAVANRDATRENMGMSRDDFVVGAVGRLEPVKGFPYLIEAAKIIAKELPDARFVLAGDGSQSEVLSEMAGALGGKFMFLGMRDDVPALMAAFDVLVVPSINEGMGRVLLEAGAASLPAVAANVGGVPDVLDDGVTGLLVPSRDAAAISQAVVGLAKDLELRRKMGGAARAKVVPDYGIERMVEQIESLYEELIEEKKLDT